MKSPNDSTTIKIDGVKLSRRSIQILQRLIYGKTARQIAHELELSPRTIESHIINIKCKLKVETKSDLIEKVIKLFRCEKCSLHLN